MIPKIEDPKLSDTTEKTTTMTKFNDIAATFVLLSLVSTGASFSSLVGHIHKIQASKKDVSHPFLNVPFTPLKAYLQNDNNDVERSASSDCVSNTITKCYNSIRKAAAIVLLGGLTTFAAPVMDINGIGSVHFNNPVANADDGARVVGQLKGSGLFFKDTLQIEAFEDPKVKGVELYISTFQIPITEKFGKNMFNDPSYASVACARTGGPVAIASNIARGPSGEEVFEEKKSLLFKELRVYRVFDEKANTVVYVSFNTRLDKGDDSNKSRFKSSLCAVNLDDPVSRTVAQDLPVTSAEK